MRRLKKIVLRALAVLLVIIIGLMMYVRVVSMVDEPVWQHISILDAERTRVGDDGYTLGNNWFRKSESGL
jgi:isopenicillin-N N-acyltransferase like protein